ncbi:phage tail protein [Pantoea sp. BAV 3049]|uniref:glycine-rich domain-containing protein n=1 Tax=Pantoea sp. BAV 3049 TaxID=2654188 RepID=UPI00131EBFFA|nr:phage tail protein [Pantoea sp. BAV 3049]
MADEIQVTYIQDLPAAGELSDGDLFLLHQSGNEKSLTYGSLLSKLNGRLLGQPKTFTASGNYTPTDGTKMIVVEVQGAGGGGGGAGSTSSSTYSAGGSGTAGGYAMSLLNIADNNITTVAVTVGAGGAAGNGAPSGGSTGGSSRFGSFITANGGNGSIAQSPQSAAFTITGTYGGTATGGNIINRQGDSSGSVICVGGLIAVPPGGNSVFGAGGNGYANWNSSGKIGTGYGSGGSGASSSNSPSAYYSGGAGAGGVVMVWEYA